MNKKEEHIELSKMMEKYESGLSNLYKIYSNKLPEHADFWNDIALEEDTHATMIQVFRTLIEEDRIDYSSRPFKPNIIKQNMEILDSHITFAKRHDITVYEAFSTAMELENLLLEKDAFKIYPGDPDELKRTLKILFDDTTKHHQKIRDYIRILRLEGEKI